MAWVVLNGEVGEVVVAVVVARGDGGAAVAAVGAATALIAAIRITAPVAAMSRRRGLRLVSMEFRDP
jgi:hypothetical protein